MDNALLLDILKEKGVTTLHHANTVATSCTFLQKGALLSRQYVEKHSLKQTDQYSDAKDKQIGVWNDIFLDGVDIHDRARNSNKYGPVLFIMDLDKLLSDPKFKNRVFVTKNNPVHWEDGEEDSDRYLLTIDEFKLGYHFGDFGKSLIFRTTDGAVDLKLYLHEIMLDDPQCLLGKQHAFDVATAALVRAAAQSKLSHIPIRKRQCEPGCKCVSTYRVNTSLVRRVFSP